MNKDGNLDLIIKTSTSKQANGNVRSRIVDCDARMTIPKCKHLTFLFHGISFKRSIR